MYCDVNLRKLLSAHKGHIREISLFTGDMLDQVLNHGNSQTYRFLSVPAQTPGK